MPAALFDSHAFSGNNGAMIIFSRLSQVSNFLTCDSLENYPMGIMGRSIVERGIDMTWNKLKNSQSFHFQLIVFLFKKWIARCNVFNLQFIHPLIYDLNFPQIVIPNYSQVSKLDPRQKALFLQKIQLSKHLSAQFVIVLYFIIYRYTGSYILRTYTQILRGIQDYFNLKVFLWT